MKKISQLKEDKIKICVDNVENLGIFLEAEITVEEINHESANIIKSGLIKNLYDSKIITNKDIPINIGYVELYLMKYNKEAINELNSYTFEELATIIGRAKFHHNTERTQEALVNRDHPDKYRDRENELYNY